MTMVSPSGPSVFASDRDRRSGWDLGFCAGRGVVWQVLVVLIVWAYVCGLQADNDGLWFQGDSPRHALNGLFWKDFLNRLPAEPKAFTFSYFARYPAINPVSYPPFFYLLEAGLFALFGPSPYLAKGLVLSFALVEALYVMVWLRRWHTEEAGYLSPVVLLLPGMVEWSHAIMLNVPAGAMTFATLYHTRRWLEEPSSWHLIAAGCLSTLATLTYFQAVVVVPIIVTWVLISRRSGLLVSPRAIAIAAVCGVILLACFVVALRWARMHAQLIAPTPRLLSDLTPWLFYPKCVYGLFGQVVPTFAALGVVVGIVWRRWRFEMIILLIWVILTYVFLSYMKAKEARYMLPLGAPLILMCSIGIIAIARAPQRIWRRYNGTGALLTATWALVVVQGWQAWHAPNHAVRGIHELADFLRTVAPDEPVLYDGAYHGTFILYVRAADPDFRRMVVRGNKLLYVDVRGPSRAPRSFISSPTEVVEVLRECSGCRWVAIENGSRPPPTRAYSYLREAVQGPPFRYIGTFPITGSPWTTRIDLYLMQVPVEPPGEIELPVPLLGRDAWIKTRPITSRRRSQINSGDE
jgi:hypothetical protein